MLESEWKPSPLYPYSPGSLPLNAIFRNFIRRFQQRSHNTSPANWCGHLISSKSNYLEKAACSYGATEHDESGLTWKRLSAGKATDILTNYFGCVFFIPCELPRLYKLEYRRKWVVSRDERVSTEDKNPMVRHVTFYELNSKNRITATGIAKDRDRKRSAH